MAKLWTKRQIMELLLHRDDAVERAILALHKRQLEDEKVHFTSRYRNGRGFNSADATELTHFANRIKCGTHLTPAQLSSARSRLMKYTCQLADIANERRLSNDDSRKSSCDY